MRVIGNRPRWVKEIVQKVVRWIVQNIQTQLLATCSKPITNIRVELSIEHWRSDKPAIIKEEALFLLAKTWYRYRLFLHGAATSLFEKQTWPCITKSSSSLHRQLGCALFCTEKQTCHSSCLSLNWKGPMVYARCSQRSRGLKHYI